MDTKEFIKRALDNGTVKLTGTGNIANTNPTIWDKDVSKYAEANLVMANLSKKYDFRGVGGDYVVSIDAAPSAAAAVAEDTEIPITGMAFTQVTFVPSEVGARFQVTDKEKRRSLVAIMENATMKLGYMYAQAIDADVLSTVRADTTNALGVNGHDATTLVTADTLGLSAFTQARRVFNEVDYIGYAAVLGPAGVEQIENLALFHSAEQYGSSAILKKGLVGNIMGFEIYETSKIKPVAGTNVDYETVVFLAKTNISGEEPMGLCIKADPSIEYERQATKRLTDLVAVGEFDVKVLHGEGIVTMKHYSQESA